MEINKKPKLDMVDLTKLILAFMVVAIHTYLLGEYIYPFVRLAVPTFFVFTGYFTFRKIDFETDKKIQKNIFRITLKRYIILYMVWFMILLPYTIDNRNYFAYGVENGIKNDFALYFNEIYLSGIVVSYGECLRSCSGVPSFKKII